MIAPFRRMTSRGGRLAEGEGFTGARPGVLQGTYTYVLQTADGQIAAKMANQFDKSSFLRRTYAPVDKAAVIQADEARRRGRRVS